MKKIKEMPEWLKKEMLKSLRSTKSIDTFYCGFEKCYEIMSQRQKPRPIETAPKKKSILIKCNYEDSENTMWIQGYKNNDFDNRFFAESGLVIESPLEWLPLSLMPEIEEEEQQ